MYQKLFLQTISGSGNDFLSPAQIGYIRQDLPPRLLPNCQPLNSCVAGTFYIWNLPALVFEQELPPSIRTFISHHVRSVEQLEILILLSRGASTAWTIQKVYDVILSTPQSVERWLEEMVRNGLLEKTAEPAVNYRCTAEAGLVSQMRELGDIYRTRPVRVIEAIYRRDATAAQSFADAFKIKNTDPKS